MSHDAHQPIGRRKFLVRAAATSAVAAGSTLFGLRLRKLLAPRPWDEAAFAPPGEARVSVQRAGYDEGLESTILMGLRAVGADVRGARVLLKPNFVEYDAGSSVNTDPRVVAAAILAFRRLGAATVVVGEGPGHRRDTEYVIRTSGLADVLSEAEARFEDLNIAPATPVRLRTHYTTLGQLWLPRVVTEADVVVSMPKLKTHHWAGVTLSLKNCFGCVPGRVYGWPKNALHWAGLNESIVDVASAVRPDLAIVDAIVGMEGNGPISGEPRDLGLLVIGNDPVATDTIAATLMGVDPEKVFHLAQASRFLGQGDRRKILDVGEDPDAFATRFRMAPEFEDLLS